MSTATLSLERTFDARRDAVFAAWTDPEVLRRWWMARPDEQDTPEAEVNLRVGGRYRMVIRERDSGVAHEVFGEYREVVPPERLVYTWTWKDAAPGTAGSVVTVVFRDDGGERTTVLLTHTGFTDPAEVPKHEHGWNAVMDTLDQKVFKAAVA